MEKIKKFSILLCLIIAVFTTSLINFNTPVIVKAEVIEDGEGDYVEVPEEDPSQEEQAIIDQIYLDLMEGGYNVDARTDLADTHLYSSLLSIIKKYIKETYNYSYSSLSTLRTTMFRGFKELSIGELDNSMDITSLEGIEKFRFNELESLTIYNNSINSIPKETFKNMPKLKNLNLACNNITSIDLTYATNLENVNLSSNKLSSINFGNNKSANLNINLANNLFTDMKDIVLPTRADIIESINLNIINNNILDIGEEYFNYSKLNMSIGLQGMSGKTDATFDTSQTLKYYKTNNSNYSLKLFRENLSAIHDEEILTLKDSDIPEGSRFVDLDASLTVGEYYYEYYEGNNSLFVENHPDRKYFASYRFTIIPSICTFSFEHKGKAYSTFENKVTGTVKVYLSCEEGGDVYYSVNGGEWTKGNEIACDKGGNYSISAKTVIGDYESEVKTVLVRTSLNTVIPDGLMLVLLLLFTLTLFFIVVPFVSKKWFSNN